LAELEQSCTVVAAAKGAATAEQLERMGVHSVGLATALQEFWQQPEQLKAVRLEVAQAAANRACANLRCPNLTLAGGPAAGQGKGCRLCGGCRVAWYCGTACSHADWKLGHRRVCKALAAARDTAATTPASR
jgi:hypothetical protein